MKSTAENEQRVLQFLSNGCLGRSEAMTAKQIGYLLRISEREVRFIISNLRQSGEAIASDSHGFYIPETEEEAKACLAHFYSRIREIAEAARGVERGLRKRFPGRQIGLDLGDIA
jgi:biotin operon repressor